MTFSKLFQLNVAALLFVIFMMFGCSTDSKTLSISPSHLDFEDVNIGDIVEKEITLKNKYGKEILISGINLTGSIDFAITVGGSVPVSLMNNDVHIIKISYTPVATGFSVSELQIDYDASSKPKLVDITGNGVPVARISLSENAYDFDKKIINKLHSHDFIVENTGTNVLNISSLSFTGTGASLYSITSGNAPFDVQMGMTHTITVTFSPIIIGTYPAELLITHNAVNGSNPLSVTIDGEGVDVDPQITLSVGSSWDFGTVATTIPSIQVCEIENTGIDPLTVTSASLSTNAEFTIDSLKDGNGNVLNFPQVVQVGSKIFLSVKFAPISNVAYQDTLSIEHDGTNEITPLDIPLSGTGRIITTVTFNYTGAVQTWTVPAGVTSIQVDCFGAEGGTNSNSVGGKGGMAGATITVTPGETLNIYVGGSGTRQLAATTGGWNGGGGTDAYGSGYAGTGGGASDIRRGSGLSDRLIVGAGGGGGGAHQYALPGGDGGGLQGKDGVNWPNWPDAHGKGGTQTAGGVAGKFTGYPASPGIFGEGGRGKGDNAGGGGGGAGWYGGGGGVFSSGGGGSSFNDASGNTNKSTQTGVQSGDGKIVLKY